MRMIGIANGDTHCCVDARGIAYWTFGQYTRDLHIDLVAQAGGSAIRYLVSDLPWIYNMPVPSTNQQYAGIGFRDYLKALVDYGKQVGVSSLIDFVCGGTKVERARMIRSQPNSYLTDIYPNGMQRQDWVNLGNEVITKCQPYAIGVGDEWFGCDHITNWYNPTPGDLMTSTDYRQFLIDCIEGWRTIDPNVTIFVQHMRHHSLTAFLNYDANHACADKSIACKGEGPLPYPNIVYMINYPTGGAMPTSSNMDWRYDEVAALLASPTYASLNQHIGFTYVGFSPTPNTLTPSELAGVTAVIHAFIDYCNINNLDSFSYGYTKGQQWNLLTPDPWLGWNPVGQAWADYITPQPPCSTYLTQAECEAAGCHWWNQLCHANSPSTFEEINNQVDCERYDGVWGEDGVCRSSSVIPQKSNSALLLALAALYLLTS